MQNEILLINVDKGAALWIQYTENDIDAAVDTSGRILWVAGR